MNTASESQGPMNANRLGLIDRVARRLVTRRLAGLKRGQILLKDASGTLSTVIPRTCMSLFKYEIPAFTAKRSWEEQIRWRSPIFAATGTVTI